MPGGGSTHSPPGLDHCRVQFVTTPTYLLLRETGQAELLYRVGCVFCVVAEHLL